MDFSPSSPGITNQHRHTSPYSSSCSASTPHPASTTDPMHSWCESVSKARSRILSLSSLLSSSCFSHSSLADSERPGHSFLSSPDAYSLLSFALRAPLSCSGEDPLCQWLYDTYLSSDPSVRLFVLSFLPLLCGLYLYRLHSAPPSLAGFEAVLLSIYSTEAKSRAGKPLSFQIPDLSQPSLYHTPRNSSCQNVVLLSPPLEPQIAVK